MTPTRQLVDEARALDKAATKGPWHACCEGRGHACRTGLVWAADEETIVASGYYEGDAPVPDDAHKAANALFIARARTLLPALADRIEAMSAVVDAAQDHCEDDHGPGCEASRSGAQLRLALSRLATTESTESKGAGR